MSRPESCPPARRAAALSLLSAVFAAGCGGGPTGRPADPAEAKTMLTDALDAWKAGETPGALARRSPPIHVSDDDWTAGFRLQAYQAGKARPFGYDLGYPVTLELKGPRGAPVKRSAVYAVTTRPEPLVVRQDR